MDIERTKPPTWPEALASLKQGLEGLRTTRLNQSGLGVDEAFFQLTEMTMAARDRGGCVFLAGNGASAGLASHCAVDLMKNGRLKTITMTDPAMVTAWGNDCSYEKIFAEPLSICLTQNDLVALISSSGRSPNILAAARAAREARSAIVTFSGMNNDNPLRNMGDLNFYVPAFTYGLAESCHAVILHHWIDLIAARCK